MKKERFYKVLATDGSACHGGIGKWPLPQGRRKGGWLTVKPPLNPCQQGLHLCRSKNLIYWLGEAIYLAEWTGQCIIRDDKIVVSKARLVRRLTSWNEKNARLFAADCATHALRKEQAAGRKPHAALWIAVQVARLFARGCATQQELSAAESAAWSAARSAAWSAAESAAWSAAESAAWSAARSAAESAAESAAWSWQTRRLMEYLEGKRS